MPSRTPRTSVMVIHVNFNFFQATFFDNIIKVGGGKRGVRGLRQGVANFHRHLHLAYKIQETFAPCLLLLLCLAFSTSFGKLNNKKYATINSGTKLGSGHTTTHTRTHSGTPQRAQSSNSSRPKQTPSRRRAQFQSIFGTKRAATTSSGYLCG